MPARKPPHPDNPAEYQRFLDMAHEVEADEDPDALDRAFEKVIRPRPPQVDRPLPKVSEAFPRSETDQS